MEGSALYNPRAHATPSQLRARSLREQRSRKIARASNAAAHASSSAKAAPAPRPIPAASIDYRGMWFYNLIFETEKHAADIMRHEPRLCTILTTVADFYHVRVRDMISARRTKDVMIPRQIAYYLCRELTLKSLPQIGVAFGGRDHTTILSGVRKIERQISGDENLELQVQHLARKLGGACA